MDSYNHALKRLPIFKLAIALWLLGTSCTVQAENKRANTVGPGIGISYGLIGVAYDRRINDKVELRLAGGIPFFWGGGLPYNIGIRYYFRNNGFWNPRVSLMHGTVVMGNFDGNPHTSVAYNNYSVGIGQSFVFNRTRRVSVTLDMDLVFSEFPAEYYADQDSAAPGHETTSIDEPFRFALGFGIRF